jgi:hypothetical protein
MKKYISEDKLSTIDDNTYLASISGMMESIIKGADASESECVPMEEIWPNV